MFSEPSSFPSEPKSLSFNSVSEDAVFVRPEFEQKVVLHDPDEDSPWI